MIRRRIRRSEIISDTPTAPIKPVVADTTPDEKRTTLSLTVSDKKTLKMMAAERRLPQSSTSGFRSILRRWRSKMAKSIEEKVEEHFKTLLDNLGIWHFGKTEEINGSITKALKEADSKSGGSGVNYPDIQLLLQNKTRRDIPVMIEAKGLKGKLEKLTSDGDIDLVSGGKNPNRAVHQSIP